MTLSELSPLYESSATLIHQRILALRQSLRETADPLRQQELRRRIAALKPIYSQCRELAQLTAHYYDRSFHRNEKYVL